ncbi:helix-turn-helix domain-containing protein [Microbaculum marinum]|uniref:helix-turn-helix domain-containing protein n=1 Tax=Microbaculum marinum TaxID=1764581 RepID=UPI00360B0F9E
MRCRPAAALQPFVVEYQGYRETPGPPVRRREMPNGNVTVIINFGADWLIGDADAPGRLEPFSSFAGGVYDRYAVSESTGGAYCMQVDFTPIGAGLFFRAPMRDLTGRVYGLGDVMGASGDRLTGRLHDAPDWAARFSILEAEIADRILPVASGTYLPAFVWRRIVSAAGDVRIGELAAECGISRKHLNVRFRDAVGVAPKTYARVCRFQRAAWLLAQPGEPVWTHVALDCGYYDQAHFIRDFRRLSGYTPGEFRRMSLADGTGIRDA